MAATRASISARRGAVAHGYCAMERGQRKMRLKRGCAVTPAISAQLRGNRGQHALVGFLQHAGVFHAAQEAAGHNLAGGHAVGEFRAHPGAGHQLPALLLRNQEAETDGRAGEIGGVEAQRHRHG